MSMTRSQGHWCIVAMLASFWMTVVAGFLNPITLLIGLVAMLVMMLSKHVFKLYDTFEHLVITYMIGVVITLILGNYVVLDVGMVAFLCIAQPILYPTASWFLHLLKEAIQKDRK